MATTTYVATTAEGNTVARSSGTKDYNYVVLAKTSTNGHARPSDDLEGAWGWSGDAVNAEKAATQARKVYASVRVVPVEQKLTGRDAKLVLDAIKAAPVQGSGTQYIGGSARQGAQPMGRIETVTGADYDEIAAAERKAKNEEILEAARLKKTAKAAEAKRAATIAKTPKVVAAKPAAPKVASKPAREASPEAANQLHDLVVRIQDQKNLLEDLYEERAALLTEIAKAHALTGAQVSAILGVTPMAALNMRKRTRKA